MKYNKKLQNRLNLSFSDYKDYSQLYSSIEIELMDVYNRYSRFINIPNKNKEYYHIYFDNSNEEIKRTYLNEDEKVKIIKIIINYQIKSFERLFSNCCFDSIIFKKFNRINITAMNSMFSRCNVKEIKFSKFKTNNVINMSHMFSECKSLKELNLSNFNTNNVTNMSDMFS